MAQTPYELTSGPVELYIGPVGESMPAIGTEPPGGNWDLVGTLGADEYNEEGVTIVYNDTVEDFRGLQLTAPLKSFRTEESMMIRATLHDMTLEEVARVINFNTVQTDTDDKVLDNYKGFEVSYKALLIRGEDAGPYGVYNIQWELPRVRISAQPELVWSKGAPVGVAMEFMVMADLNRSADSDAFGVLRTQFQN